MVTWAPPALGVKVARDFHVPGLELTIELADSGVQPHGGEQRHVRKVQMDRVALSEGRADGVAPALGIKKNAFFTGPGRPAVGPV